jgi:superfamily II DNA or RNA helicase
MRELRSDQQNTIDQVWDKFAGGHKRACVQAPTGFGKTVFAGEIARRARAKGKKVLFTVPAISLIDQTVRMFYEQGVSEVGVIQAHHAMTDWSKPVQVASVQTLMKRERLPEADIVMADEIHRWFTAYATWFSQDGFQVPVIGLSATPWTKGLGDVFKGPWNVPMDERKQCHIIAATTAGLIADGHLSDFRVYAPTHPDLSEIKTVAGDYHEGQLSKKMQEGALVADAVDTWKRLWGKDKTLCFAVDRAHAKTLQMKFEASGVPCGYQDAFTKDQERDQIRRDFHSGAIKVVCNVGTLTTGIDWDVRCISLCRPTKSDMLFVQIIGRGLRTAPGKENCLILDHSDNHQRLGFVTDIDASYIALKEGKTPAGGDRTDSIRLPKECPKCAYLRSPRISTCPQCGFKAEVVSSIKADEGELRELKRKPKVVEEMDRAVFYAELKAHALMRGFNSGWVSHKYREKFGNWPPPQYKSLQAAGTISEYTRGFIKSRNIAWAKGAAKADQKMAFADDEAGRRYEERMR